MKKRKKRQEAVAQDVPQKVRIGYLSSDFGAGRTRDLLPTYVFSYDDLRYEIYAYHTGQGGDTEPFVKEVTLREVGGVTAEEAAAAIRADGIDLLVDLSLHVPDAAIRSIMELRPAPHIVSLAEDCPTALAAALPTVEGARIPSRIYTPFKRVHRYTVRTPLLDTGVPAIGIAGQLTEGTVTLLVDLLCDVLHEMHAVCLVLPAAIAEALSAEEMERIAAAGTEMATLELVDELPYETPSAWTSISLTFAARRIIPCRSSRRRHSCVGMMPCSYLKSSGFLLCRMRHCLARRSVTSLLTASGFRSCMEACIGSFSTSLM